MYGTMTSVLRLKFGNTHILEPMISNEYTTLKEK